MNTVIGVRISRRLKERMDRFKDRVNWAEEIRKFLEEKVRELEREEVLQRVEEMLKDLPIQPRGAISSIVREDRDSH